MIKLRAVLIVVAMCISVCGWAQTNELCSNQLVQASQIPDQAERQQKIKRFLSVKLRPACVVEVLLSTEAASGAIWIAYKSAVQTLQQSGPSVGGGSGSTNLVSKPIAAQVLSLASDYGTLTQSTSGQTTTFSGSLDGVPLAVEAKSQGLFTECSANLLKTSVCLPSPWLTL